MQLYSDQSYHLSASQAHPAIELKRIPGKGRGMVVTSDSSVIAGEVLFFSRPLAFKSGKPGHQVNPSALTSSLGQLSQADKRRLQFLLDSDKVSLDDLLNAEEMIKKEEQARASSAKGFGSQPLPAAAEATITPLQIEQLLQSSSFGHLHNDLALSSTRGEGFSSFVGLWPTLALLNHSCAPSSLPVLVGDSIVVRAARQIRGSEEITISYLGNERMMPVMARNKRLVSEFGFECNCFRCQVERKQPEEITQKISSIHEWLNGQDLIIRAKRALGASDNQEVEKIKGECEARQKELQDKMDTLHLSPEEQLWLKCAVYGLYELSALCKDGAKSDPSIPASLSNLVAAVAPGSETHLLLALDRLLRAGERERTGPNTEAAAKDAIMAYGIRYGLIGDKTLTMIMDTLAKVQDDLGRYSIVDA
jgi:hypothetical protein